MKWLTFLFVVSCAATALAEAPATTQASSNTRWATRTLVIKTDKFGPDANTLLMACSDMASELGTKVLGIPAERIKDCYVMQALPGANIVQLNIALTLKNGAGEAARPAAREFADQLTAELKTFVQRDYDQQCNELLEPLAIAQDQATHRVDETQERVKMLRDKMRAASGRADVSSKEINEAMIKLEDEKHTQELEALGKKARRDALEQQVAKLAGSIEEKVAKDAIVSELQKAVDAREEKAKFVKQQFGAGLATQAEGTDAVAAAADARAKLLQRRREATSEAGGETLDAFNHELLTLSVDQQELDARVKYIDSQLPGLRTACDLTDELDRAEADLLDARNELRAAEKKIRDLQLATGRPPQFSVFGSENAALPPPQPNEPRPSARDVGGPSF